MIASMQLGSPNSDLSVLCNGETSQPAQHAGLFTPKKLKPSATRRLVMPQGS